VGAFLVSASGDDAAIGASFTTTIARNNARLSMVRNKELPNNMNPTTIRITRYVGVDLLLEAIMMCFLLFANKKSQMVRNVIEDKRFGRLFRLVCSVVGCLL
jgi:hypothetical protein